MAKSKEQRRAEAQARQNAHSWQRVDIPLDMPFLAGGYTQTDWDILNGAMVDLEFYYDYCKTPSEQYNYIERTTKPYWA